MFPCTLCDVKLNSFEQRKAHCRGKNHVKRVAAKEKALEIGADFHHTPDHCEVCNVPLTSKMTAIDHFKGKMHQKKVKAVEDLRQGFQNFCDVCDVRLQSLKVSEAHFNGKQHRKRERKMNLCCGIKDKNQTTERKPSKENPGKVCNISQTSFIVAPNHSSCNSTFPWESLNCDSDSESKDPLSEFRSSLSAKSSSPDEARTPHSTSPKDPNESYFSFEKIAMLQKTTLSNSESTYNRFNSNNELNVSPTEYEPSFAKRQTQQPKTVLTTDEVFQINDGGLWESKAKHLPNYLNETCNSTLRESTFIHEYTVKNGVAPRSHDFKELTQKVLHFFTQIDSPISCDDVAKRVGCASPDEVRSVLCRLEKRKKLSKSGYNPTLWSARPLRPPNGNTVQTSQSYVTSNTRCQAENYPRDSRRETSFFQKTNDSYLINSVALPTTQTPSFRPSAILSTSTTAASPPRSCSRENVSRPSDLPPVFESNIVNLFQQNQSAITTGEILTKLDFPDEVKVRAVLHDLLQRRVITKESADTPQRWRLVANATPRPNDVGVIGEERKRKSPVQNNFASSNERSVERIRSSPPQQNGFSEATHDTAFRGHLPEPEKHQKADHIYNGETNGVWRDVDRLNGLPNVQNGIHQKACSVTPRFQENHIVFPAKKGDMKRHEFETHGGRSPPSSTIEFLDDLTLTPPTSYQKELYQEAMQEDILCYLPIGTGQGVVMASVVHHIILVNPTKQALIIVGDTVSALEKAEYLQKELSGNVNRKKVNVGVLSGALKQQDNKRQVVVTTSMSCLRLLNCGALSWENVCLLVFDQAGRCINDDPSHQILRDYYLKAKADFRSLNVPKVLGFLDSSSGEKNCTKTVAKFNSILVNMGDVCLSCVTQNRAELEENKDEAMFVCVLSSFTKSEQRMFSALHSYLLLVFDHLASQCQPLNSYRELLQLSFQRYPINGEAFEKFVRLTGKPLDKRLSTCCLKTWRHYLAICEVMFSLVECGEDFAKVLLGNLKREAFGFSWANEVGLPVNELSLYLLPPELPKKLTSGNVDGNLLGSGIRELIEQLQIIQWENARVSSERPLALVIVKLSKTAKALANYLARYPELSQRNVRTVFIDGSNTSQQRTIVSATKRRQYQVIVSTDDIQDELDLPHCELVILMDQPTTVSALVKLRQRQGTNVVAICREAAGEEKLKELLKKEEDVEKAIDIIRGVQS